MDLAYDHIAQESLPRDEDGRDHSNDTVASPQASLNSDIQAAYSAFSATASPWASRIGGFFGNVVKQGESVYREAQQEVTALGQDATKSLSGLRKTIVSHTRNLSLGTGPTITAQADASSSSSSSTTKDATATPTVPPAATGADDDDTVLARIKGEAAKRLRDLQRAEDAADEALIKFGTGLRDFLREAITITPPTTSGASGSNAAVTGNSTVLFESKDAQGKRVIHTSRFDAQLHVIHTSSDSFVKDPAFSAEFVSWSSSFDIDKKTADIASDLKKYPELRATMEKLVPATTPYADFWKRYYFLRHGIETAEARRRDLLKAASAEEEIGWDEDSEDDEDDESDEDDSDEESDDDSSTDGESKAAGKAPAVAATVSKAPAVTATTGMTPAGQASTAKAPAGKAPAQRTVSAESSTTIQPPKSTTTKPTPQKIASTTSVDGLLKPGVSPRKSDEKSVADSEASYDMVGAKSGVTSQAPNSPEPVDEDSEEEDWE
ncbi:hypothetical protein SEPCBS57363_002701 [Sporothrix epigloea]|uniref:BSD domain-containing protein n=1 Tax=Sporothrix epigloea TaxID=1892477 RepID=A0ABP0DKW0_9PEZI